MIEIPQYDNVGSMILELVPAYKSRSWTPFVVSFKWDQDAVDNVWNISESRCEKRIASYVDPQELKRSKGSIRFGVKKEGHGFHKERGDFCLVGGSLVKGHLSVYYRRVELLGGFHYDLAIFERVAEIMGPIKRVTMYASHAMVFALKGNSNEKLYQKLKRHYATQS